MVPMTQRAKLAELKRLRREMRRIMSETGVESEEPEMGLESLAEEDDEDEAELLPKGDELAASDDDDGLGEDDLRRELRKYMNKKAPPSRPGAGLMALTVEAGPSKMSSMGANRRRS